MRKGDFLYMGEALITKYGGKAIGEGYTLHTEIFTKNGHFTVPRSKDQKFAVRLFGGGGGYGAGGGGGSGNMNFGILKLNFGEDVYIAIGSNGANGWDQNGGNNGGVTSFGSYLSATGGEGGSIFSAHKGGNGGAGGGGGSMSRGGDGTYGGGGGGGWAQFAPSSYWGTDISGGNGGIYGGGGGCGWGNNTASNFNIQSYTRNYGISLGGWGNGGNDTIMATDGKNTICMQLDYVGEGKAGANKYRAGGGGYGGNGGTSNFYTNDTGYRFVSGGGGGGGYGADGYSPSVNEVRGGGGGGYGNNASGAGGGGYGPEGYSKGGDSAIISGSTTGYMNASKPGICIISYLEPLKTKLE